MQPAKKYYYAYVRETLQIQCLKNAFFENRLVLINFIARTKHDEKKENKNEMKKRKQ